MKKQEIDTRLLNVAAKIKKLRIDKGYKSYVTFALDFDLNARFYFNVEKGTNISLDYLLKILDAHKLSLQDFFNDSF